MNYDNDPNLYEPYPAGNKPRSWLIPLFLGLVIGVILVLTLIPFITGTVAEDNKEREPAHVANEQAEDEEVNYVKYDVTTDITEVVADVSAAVVSVTNIQMQANFWEQRGNSEAGTGSGVIYKVAGDDAYIVTNHHVIQGADAVEVVLQDETSIEAQVVGSDLYSDLAVLRMDAKYVEKVIELGSSDMLKVGEPAIAIGNPLGHMFSGSVTKGVISGKQRTIPVDFNQDGRADWQAEVIQTDAAINPGNSGGALINIKGQLIGINSMKINQASVEGLGFAIPIDAARPVMKELEETGEVKRAYLGVEIYSLEEVPKVEWGRTLYLPEEVESGVYIWTIEPFSPAYEAGLKRLDVITALDGQPIKNTIELRKVLYQEKQIGDTIDVTYYREGEKYETTVTLGVQ